MTEHLLALELGPVVQIIAAARKTRDLYFGSWMLSEIAKAAARTAAELCGAVGRKHEALLVPAPAGMDELADEQFAMGDEILVRVPDGVSPSDVARAAQKAAHDRWLEFAREARQQVRQGQARMHRSLLRDADADIWHQQTAPEIVPETAGELVEVYAAWTPLTGNYQDCLARVKRLLLGRCCCRNFPPTAGHPGVPKSSLDGRRESVLVRPAEQRQAVQNRKLRLNRGEQLDALGVTKRVGDGKKNFPSTARLAAEPWIHGASRAAPPEFAALVAECDRLAARQNGGDPVLGRVETRPPAFPHYPQYAAFPFEGAILFENRHHEFVQEAALEDGEEQVAGLKRALRSVFGKRGQPGSYYVALVADGDRVGESLRACQCATEHREFSQRLSSFAAGVRPLVDSHRGALIFAAGEDISALLPLHTALECADALRRRFDEVLNAGHATRRATLSVGLAIGHFLDALEDTLAAAREMESLAKRGEKNAVAVQYRARGGAPIEFRASWAAEPLNEINQWIALLANGDLPDKVAFDVRRVAESYRGWPAESEGQLAQRRRALQADLARLLSRKRSSARQKIEPLLSAIDAPLDAIGLAHKIIMAGLMGNAQRQALGDNP